MFYDAITLQSAEFYFQIVLTIMLDNHQAAYSQQALCIFEGN